MARRDDIARTRLYGRRATYGQLASEAVRLRAGNPELGLEPMPLQKIATRLGFKQPKSVADLLQWATEWNIVADASRASGLAKDTATFSYSPEVAEFSKHPLIAKWIEGMRLRSHGGVPLKTVDTLLRNFMVICNTTRTDPAQWATGSREEILENGRKLMGAFMDAYKEGRAAINYKKNWTVEKADLAAVAHSYAKGPRNFLYTLGYAYPRGEASLMSASVTPFHGNFADVAITEADYLEAKHFIKNNWGLDSDIFRWFGAGMEGLARARGLHGMTVEKEVFTTKDGRRIYIMKAFESKTEHWKKGIWKKWIISQDIQEAIDAVEGGYIITERRFKQACKDVYPKLKETYRHLGLAHKNLANPRTPIAATLCATQVTPCATAAPSDGCASLIGTWLLWRQWAGKSRTSSLRATGSSLRKCNTR